MQLQMLSFVQHHCGSVQLDLKLIKTSSQYLHGKETDKICTFYTRVKSGSASWYAKAPFDTAVYSLVCYCFKQISLTTWSS